jgi:hypothetical protein
VGNIAVCAGHDYLNTARARTLRAAGQETLAVLDIFSRPCDCQSGTPLDHLHHAGIVTEFHL